MGSHRAAPSKLNADHRRALAEVLRPVARSRRSTEMCAGGARTWPERRRSQSQLDETTVGRELKGPRLRQDLGAAAPLRAKQLAVEAFKKNFPAELAKIRARLPKGVEIELWWQDEARIGQKNKLTRRWARRGTRPRAPRDQRTEWAYIFGAICPAKGKGAGLVMPWWTPTPWRRTSSRAQCRRRSRRPCGADRRSGRLALDAKLAIPDNITVLALRHDLPELNPVENVWPAVSQPPSPIR